MYKKDDKIKNVLYLYASLIYLNQVIYNHGKNVWYLGYEVS